MLLFLAAIAAPSASGIDVAAAFDAHGAWLLQVTERLCSSRSAAEDIVQEAFLVLHRKRARLTDGEDLRGWLYTVAKNLVLHHRRSIARQLRLQDKAERELPTQQGADGDKVIERRQMGERVQRAASKLPIKQREVFVLYELQGMAGKDIASMLDIPEGTVWTRLHHARAGFEQNYKRLLEKDAR